jgi:flavin-dependent dehydrogenase
MTAADWLGTLVLGGGLAGTAAAITLAHAGHPVRLWERERHPHHKICGEFLSWEGQALLADLGLDLDALGAERIDRLRLATARRVVDAPLGFIARSITRHCLDAALLDRAAEAGVVVERGVTARGLMPDGLVAGTHGELRPARLLLATGKHNLRGVPRDGAGTIRDQLGFKAYFRLSPAQRAELAGHVELILFAGGYAGLQPVEREAANLCFLVPPDRWAEAGGDFARLLDGLGGAVPHLARRLDGAVPLLDRPLAISGVPYGFLHRAQPEDPLWRLGDQAAVIPSFTGDGMSLALHSGRLAGRMLLAGAAAPAFAERFRRDVRGPVGRATWAQARLGDGGGAEALVRAVGVAPWLVPHAVRLTRLKAGVVG